MKARRNLRSEMGLLNAPQICQTETKIQNVTFTEDVQKCADEPRQICRTETKTVPITYFEAEQNCVKVPYEVRTVTRTLNRRLSQKEEQKKFKK